MLILIPIFGDINKAYLEFKNLCSIKALKSIGCSCHYYCDILSIDQLSQLKLNISVIELVENFLNINPLI